MQALASTPLQAAAVGNVAVVSVAERSDPKGMFMHKELSVKSRVRGDFHARFCERVKLPRSTRPMTCHSPKMKKYIFTFLHFYIFTEKYLFEWDSK